MEEFTYLNRNIDWFKSRQDQKLISVNLEDRKKQKADDDAFRKQMKAERERIAMSDFAFTELRLSPKQPPKPKAVKKDADKDKDASADEDESDSLDEDTDTYLKADIHLRETLRVVGDAIALGRNKELWAANRPPLTAVSSGG